MLLKRACFRSHHKLCPSLTFVLGPTRSSLCLGRISVQAKCLIREEFPGHGETGCENGEAFGCVSIFQVLECLCDIRKDNSQRQQLWGDLLQLSDALANCMCYTTSIRQNFGIVRSRAYHCVPPPVGS
jgi:hypothetical protein